MAQPDKRWPVVLDWQSNRLSDEGCLMNAASHPQSQSTVDGAVKILPLLSTSFRKDAHFWFPESIIRFEGIANHHKASPARSV